MPDRSVTPHNRLPQLTLELPHSISPIPHRRRILLTQHNPKCTAAYIQSARHQPDTQRHIMSTSKLTIYEGPAGRPNGIHLGRV